MRNTRSKPSSAPVRWVSWAAVSTQLQAAADNVSIPEQQRLNREHAAKHGGEIVSELVVPGESRSIDTWEEACERVDAYARLRDLLNKNAFDVLVFYDTSRLARTASLGLTIRQLCLRRGIILYATTTPPREMTAPWRYDHALLDAITSVGAQEEVARLVERRRIGMAGRIRRGEMASNIPYGYRRGWDENGQTRVEINLEEAGVVRLILNWYLQGWKMDRIGRHLDASGHKTPQRAVLWSRTSLHVIIDNVWKYAGYVEYNVGSQNGEPYIRSKGNHEAIISEEIAEQVDAERAQRKANRRIPETKRRFTGVVRCAECGGTMCYQAIRKKNSLHKMVYLVCYHHKPTPRIQEALVLAAMRQAILDMQEADLRAAAEGKQEPADLISGQIEEAETILRRTERSLRKADEAYLSDLMDVERYREQVER